MLKPLQVLNPRPLRALSSHLNKLVAGRLWLKVLLGMFLGIVVGVLLGPSLSLVNTDLASTIGNWLAGADDRGTAGICFDNSWAGRHR